MTTTKRRRIFTTAALIAAVTLVLILASTALHRGGDADKPAGQARGDSVERIETASVTGERVTVPSTRPTVLFFMASWCYTCVPQAEAMKNLEQEYAGKADFVAVDVTPENTKADVDEFRKLAGNPSHPYVIDKTSQLTKKYGITSLDTTVVVASDGEVLGRADARPMKADDLRAFLDKTLP